MKKVKYTTEMFGSYEDGTVIVAYKVADSADHNDIVMLFHPRNEDNDYDGCGSVEFAKFDHKSETYKSLRNDTYINLNRADEKRFASLIKGKKK